jgi:hypothetical protein
VKKRVLRFQLYREVESGLEAGLKIMSPSAVGCIEFAAVETKIGTVEFCSQNRFEDSMMTRGGQLRTVNGETEHQAPDLNPNTFPPPERVDSTVKLDGRWVNETVLGILPAPNTGNANISGSSTSMQVYDSQGVTGFRNPGTGGILKIHADSSSGSTEIVHYGGHSTESTGTESFNSLGRNWGDLYSAGPHYGYDYKTNPTPPPATILSPHHAAISTYYPNRTLVHWMGSAQCNRLMAPMPVPYAPKGSRCGVFMPIILRFLASRRRRSGSSSPGAVTIKPTIS